MRDFGLFEILVHITGKGRILGQIFRTVWAIRPNNRPWLVIGQDISDNVGYLSK